MQQPRYSGCLAHPLCCATCRFKQPRSITNSHYKANYCSRNLGCCCYGIVAKVLHSEFRLLLRPVAVSLRLLKWSENGFHCQNHPFLQSPSCNPQLTERKADIGDCSVAKRSYSCSSFRGLLSQGRRASGSVAKTKAYAKRGDQHLFSGWISAYHELENFPLATIIMEKKMNER